MVGTESRVAPIPGQGKPLHIVGISGALRRGSLNTKLIQAAEHLVPEGCTLCAAAFLPPRGPDRRLSSVLEWRDVPIYDQDLEGEGVIPEAVMRVRNEVLAADGILIACPECASLSPSHHGAALNFIRRQLQRPRRAQECTCTLAMLDTI
jgi:hypothetical protein